MRKKKREFINYIIQANFENPIDTLGWFENDLHFKSYICTNYKNDCLSSSYLFTPKGLNPGYVAKILYLYMEE